MNKILLKDIAISQTGPFGSQLHEHDYVSFGTPIVTVEHLGEIGFTHQNLPFVSDEDRDRLKKYILREGDIVFSRVGSVDRCTYVSRKEEGWLFSGRCIRVRVDQSKADPKFVSFYFRLRTFKSMMINISVGATMPSLNTSLMDNIPLKLPGLTTQKKIASVLSALDNKIENNKIINAELEAMAKTLYDYWFVQFDFPGTNGKPYKSSGGKMVFNERLKREIPEGWEVNVLENVLLRFTKGITTQYVEKSGLINLNQKVNRGFSLDRQHFKYLDDNINVPEEKFAKEKDILINSLGQGTLGRVHYFCENRKDVVIDQHIFILRVNDKKILASYLYLALSSASYQKQIDRQVTGSTGMQMLNGSDLKGLTIITPSIDILQKFEDIIYTFFERVVNSEVQNQQLAALRDWLLPMLMNGQVTVGDAKRKAEEALSEVAEPI
jgi:type I restriction enzyme S subunit